MELEVTLTPESEVTSTVISNNSNNSNDSDRSNDQSINAPANTPTVTPPTAIVRFPNMVTLPSQNQTSTMGHIHTNPFPNTTTNTTSYPHSSSTSQLPLLITTSGSTIQTNTNVTSEHVFSNIVQRSISTSNEIQQRAAIMASSSSLPYLQLQSSQTLHAISQSSNNNLHTSSIVTNVKVQPKIPGKGGRGSRANNNRPPPGAVNLERSYQICQAVIQNSPNRHQLKAQLRPPPSLLATATTNNSATSTNKLNKRDDNISSTNKIVYKV